MFRVVTREHTLVTKDGESFDVILTGWQRGAEAPFYTVATQPVKDGDNYGPLTEVGFTFGSLEEAKKTIEEVLKWED